MRKRKQISKSLLIALLAFGAPLTGVADENIDLIVEDFQGTFGESTDELVTALRNGDDFSFEVEGELIEGDNLNDPLGYGEITLVLALAESRGATESDVLDYLYTEGGEGILDYRLSGMGWGQIFALYDLTPGEVIGPLKSKGAVPEHAFGNHPGPSQQGGPSQQENASFNRPESPQQKGVANRPERPERPVNASELKPDRPEPPNRPDRP